MSAGIVAATMSADSVSGIESYHPQAVKNVFPLFSDEGGRHHAVCDDILAATPGLGPLANAPASESVIAVFAQFYITVSGDASSAIREVVTVRCRSRQDAEMPRP